MAELPTKIKSKINWNRRALRRWPTAVWIDGEGRFAVLAHCRSLSIELHERRDDAEGTLKSISNQCGGACYNDHELIDLSLSQSRSDRKHEDFRWRRPEVFGG